MWVRGIEKDHPLPSKKGQGTESRETRYTLVASCLKEVSARRFVRFGEHARQKRGETVERSGDLL